MKKIAAIILLFFFTSAIYGQEETADSTKILDEVTIKAFEQNKSLRNSTATVKIIEFNNGDRNNKTSLVNGFNTVPGVRMEERSPGSYRINIRGSSLRSPFGVRNVKIFFETHPKITDEEKISIMKQENSAVLIRQFADALDALDPFDEDSIKKCFSFLMKKTGIKGKAAFEPIRIALTGETHGPGLYAMIALFGKKKSVQLLKDSLQYC